MISRIRLEAFGSTAGEVERKLVEVATKIGQLNINGNSPSDLMHGEQVIQREVGEPEGRTAYAGRLILHPNVAEPDPPEPVTDPFAVTRSTPGVDVRAATTNTA